MAKVSRLTDVKHAWSSCIYCTNLEFKGYQDFTRHLRERHCTREGGSFVCRYGYNGVCSSLPVEGVSDEDYEDHVYKHHVFPHQPATNSNVRRNNLRKLMGSQAYEPPNIVTDGQQWTVYSASQNLAAVLNDPNRGKQRDFFTKLWGDGFVEKVDIPKSPYLPEISFSHFEPYLKKIARRYRKHARMNASTPKLNSHTELLQHFPNLRAMRSLEKFQLDMSGIPKVFLQPSMDLSHQETFISVFPFAKEPLSRGERGHHSGKLLEEKLSHYMDEVEVQIAQQVAQKSEAFFHVMTSHDALMEQLVQTITVVKALRDKIHHIDKSLVKDSLNILRLERLRHNHYVVFDKLKLMATVHQTQPTIQLLLATSDYVGALDLISTTQEVLVQELAGIHSFRHLSSQLLEMEKLVDKMLSTEFERYATADLNRPLVEDCREVLQEDKLITIISGMLRQKKFSFVDTYKDEVFTTIKAIIKQMMIEVVAANDSGDLELSLTGTGDQLQGLDFDDWLYLMKNITTTLLHLIYRVKAVHDVIKRAAEVSAGKRDSSQEAEEEDEACLPVALMSDPADCFLSSEELDQVSARLRLLLTSVCDCAHERVSQLLAPPGSKVQHQGFYSLVDKATAAQVFDLVRLIDRFCEGCEAVSGKTSTALKSAFKALASKFVQRFHQDRKIKLNLILNNERWKQADVPAEFQDLVDQITATGKFVIPKRESVENEVPDRKPGGVLVVGEEEYAVVGTALILLKLVAEYCACAEDLSVMAPNLFRHLAELLQQFNSKCCQLVLGAGALQQVGLKTITTTNLALASRALQLTLWLVPHVRNHFQALLQNQQTTGGHRGALNFLDSVARDIDSHVERIRDKVLMIIGSLVGDELQHWGAKPPVPSQAFQSIFRQLTKLHEAVSNILPETQVHDLYRTINQIFKDRLRDQLVKMNVVNNGRPQHGVVTSELTFYLETLKTLRALPAEELTANTMDDIWLPR